MALLAGFGVQWIRHAAIEARSPRSYAMSHEIDRAKDAICRIEGGKQSYGQSYVTVSAQDGEYLYNRIEFNLRGGSGTIVPIDDARLKNLEGLGGIVGLDLSQTKITDAGLASIKTLATLEYLQLSRTAVTDRGLGGEKVTATKSR